MNRTTSTRKGEDSRAETFRFSRDTSFATKRKGCIKCRKQKAFAGTGAGQGERERAQDRIILWSFKKECKAP